MKYHHERNEEIKSKLRDTIVNDSIPFYFDRFEKIVSENGGYFVNGKVCIIYYIVLSIYILTIPSSPTYSPLNLMVIFVIDISNKNYSMVILLLTTA